MKKIKVFDSASGYDLAAKEYDKRESYLGSFEKDQVIPLLGDLKGKKVLDIGAGTGRLSLKLAQAGAEVTALDVSEKMLDELTRKNKKIKTVIGDAESLPFENETFDLATAAFLIVHLKDPTRFFDEVYRVLKNEGLFLVTNINQKDPPKIKAHDHDFVIESFYHRPEKIREILESLAFGIEQEIFVKENGVWVNQLLLCKK
jgi:ubiquinone/menaquinone biosynthesis C-methylase UbiE